MSHENHPLTCTVTFDGKKLTGPADQPLVDFLAAQGMDLPHVCYHRALGPLRTCDVCWVETGGELVRGCTLRTREGLVATSTGSRAASDTACFDWPMTWSLPTRISRKSSSAHSRSRVRSTPSRTCRCC